MVYFVQILYTYIFYHCPATGMQHVDEVSPSIILASRALLVKMLTPLEFGSNFVYLCIYCMQNSDQASPSIILADRALLVKML